MKTIEARMKKLIAETKVKQSIPRTPEVSDALNKLDKAIRDFFKAVDDDRSEYKFGEAVAVMKVFANVGYDARMGDLSPDRLQSNYKKFKADIPDAIAAFTAALKKVEKEADALMKEVSKAPPESETVEPPVAVKRVYGFGVD